LDALGTASGNVRHGCIVLACVNPCIVAIGDKISEGMCKNHTGNHSFENPIGIEERNRVNETRTVFIIGMFD
jgi:hypothetical protein